MKESNNVAGVLKSGGVIAYPTDTVYGLGCDPNNKNAVNKLLKIKQRPEEMGLILLGSSISGIEDWIDIDNDQKTVLESESSIPTTYLAPKTGSAPSWITGKHSSVAIRVTQKDPIPFFHALLGSPIVSTSANYHGETELKSFEEVQEVLLGIVDFIVEGSTAASSKPSRIVDILTNDVIRG
ncbi:MAG TPA: L-threonylcarbamoyladenylate synthase [Gammaproteobacteria bacterium]|nr:L-threonylcarbamoyladenylate synthase [Gammaproteobacteria bacterium]